MSKKCPKIVQIDKDTHKLLKLLAIESNCSMGQMVKVLIFNVIKMQHNDIHDLKCPVGEKLTTGEGVIQNDEI